MQDETLTEALDRTLRPGETIDTRDPTATRRSRLRGRLERLVAGRTERYRILDRLGEGGMGVVHRARQRGLDREVALEQIAPGRSSPDTVAAFLSESAVTGLLERTDGGRRFWREVRVLARVRARCVVPLLDAGVIEGRPYLAVRLMEDGSLLDHPPSDAGNRRNRSPAPRPGRPRRARRGRK